MDVTRRRFLAAATVGTVSIAGCIEGELADTSYDCEVNEPASVPNPSQPAIGDKTAPVTVQVYHDYSERVSSIFATEVLDELLKSKVDTGAARFEFHDLPVPGEEEWAHQLASVGRYLFAEHGQDAYRRYLNRIYEHQEDLSWQTVGDIANKVGAQPCTVISHGSWKTYEEQTANDKDDALAAGINEVPSIVVNGQRLHGLAPVSESYQQIADEIDDHSQA